MNLLPMVGPHYQDLSIVNKSAMYSLAGNRLKDPCKLQTAAHPHMSVEHMRDLDWP